LYQRKVDPCGNTLRQPLNINLDIKNERQDCKIGTVCVLVRGEGEGRRLR
jgi:hypothetical protein